MGADIKDLVEKYKQGLCLREIAAEYNVSHQYIQQRLAREGITRKDGGIETKRVMLARDKIDKRNKRKERIERDCIRRWGCSKEKYNIIRAMNEKRYDSPIMAYVMQRHNAQRRGITWEFNLWSWWEIWDRSGKYAKRGTHHGEYGMGRIADQGPYSPENVYIVESVQNTMDYWAYYR